MSSSARDQLRLPTVSGLLGVAMLGVASFVVVTWLLVVVAPWLSEIREPPVLDEDGTVAYADPARIGLLTGSVVALLVLAACLAATFLLWPDDTRTRTAQRRGAAVAALLSVGGAVIGTAGLLGTYGMEFPAFYAVMLVVSLLMLAAAMAIGYEAPQRRAVASAP